MNLVTWNMQGLVNAPYINQVVQQSDANVLCLQECGQLDQLLHNPQPIFDGAGAIIGYTGNLVVGQGFMECVFWENANVQLSLAILSNVGYSAFGILAPVPAPYVPANPRFMPWMRIVNPGVGTADVFSMHAPSAGTANACSWINPQIVNINATAPGAWACLGDFNADPTVAAYVPPPVGNVVHGPNATQQGGGLLDYVVATAPVAFLASTPLVGASDHFPQAFNW